MLAGGGTKSLQSRRNSFILAADVLNVDSMGWAVLGSSNKFLLKTLPLCQKTPAVCENQLRTSRWFIKHFKQCTQKDLGMPVNKRHRSQAVRGHCFSGQTLGGLGGTLFMA